MTHATPRSADAARQPADPQRSQLVVFGAGGHGREVADIAVEAQRAGGPEVIGFADSDSSRKGDVMNGHPILGGWDWLDDQDRDRVGVAVAVGTPNNTERLCRRVRDLGFALVSVVSPLAHISAGAQIGPGALVFPFVSVHVGARIGEGVTLNVGSSVSHESTVGNWSTIAPGARLAGAVTVGEAANIGMMSAVIQTLSVGDRAVVGAGAVVVRDVAAGQTVVGVPARPI